jgi:hypothetical protein
MRTTSLSNGLCIDAIERCFSAKPVEQLIRIAPAALLWCSPGVPRRLAGVTGTNATFITGKPANRRRCLQPMLGGADTTGSPRRRSGRLAPAAAFEVGRRA